ncbi:hypothetical protein Leryth_001353 [Lithospermum erythrorhizon]|nr:hypothetical protein Leryth_001353 [Lithospermum erythrorhizon]
MRATCHELISAATETRTNEEEDIFTMTHGLPLKGDGDDKCLSMLHAVDETVSRQLRAARSPSSKKRILEDIEPLQSNIDLEEGFCKALLCRLRFRKHFYHVLTCMRRPQGKGLESAGKHIVTCLSELDLMLKWEEFLKLNNSCGTDENGRECKTTASGCQPVGFDSTLNSRLSAPTPPRAIKLLSWNEAIEYFRKLLRDLEVICSLTLDPILDNLLHFIVDFQKSRPDLVARTYLQLLLIQDGKLYGRNCIFDVICMASQLPDSAKRHSIQNNEVVVQLGQLLLSLLKIICANTAWQRRKLGKILQDWRVIHVQLELAFRKEFGDLSTTLDDENLCSKICIHILNWIEELTYWIGSRFLMLGFDLELYSSSEYCMVYWYIYVILIKLAEKTHLKMISSSESNRRKGKKKKELLRDTLKDYRVPPSVSLLQCQIYVAEGLTLMLAALRNEKQTFQDPGLFNSEHEIFMQHFGLLQKACLPDHVFYSSFKEITSQASLPTIAMYNCFKDAQRIAKELRSSFSTDPVRMEELRRIEQVAERNDVALNVICRLGKLDPSLNVYFEFNHHPYFAIAVVKRS